ncbi:MAG: ATP-binding protein [Synechococcus sp.]
MNELEQWQQNNEVYLAKALTWLRLRLLQQARSHRTTTATSSGSWLSRLCKPFRRHRLASASTPVEKVSDAKVRQAYEEMLEAEKLEPRPAMILLSQRFGLSRFEQQVLLLCAALELDTRIAELCARAQDNFNRPYPTFALVLSLFDEPAWDVLSPERPLRYWRLIEINQPGAQPLTTSPLRSDERIVNYIKGLNYLDDRLAPLLVPLETAEREIELPPSQQEELEAIMGQLEQAHWRQRPPLIQLIGADSMSKQLMAQRAAAELKLDLCRLPVELLPVQASELETFARLWQRESLLLPFTLYLDAQDTDGPKPAGGQAPPLYRFLSRCQGLLFLSTREIHHSLGRPTILADIDKPTAVEQEEIWAEELGDVAANSPALLAGQFNLNALTIQQIAQTVLAEIPSNGDPVHEKLWAACLGSTRPQLDVLAQRLDPKATWEDIVLPEEEKNLLHQIADQVRQRGTVYEEWGFHRRMNRGLGISALFAGDSGTGKTMAAEVIANDLDLNLYRIDLSAVVSKYIGETEKNLRRLFDAAEDGGAILFFDEADALFGKRSEVKDSHDRYANIEINYLLQRMEAYRGLAILATNMRSSLDNAFVRRLRFIVNFPFPSLAEREAIWERVFPTEMHDQELLKGLDRNRLARFNLTGGSIHNIALNAAFLAAQKNTLVTMPLVMAAARAEFRKLERPINELDFRWQEPKGVKI